jgi:aspartate racemase
MKLMILGILGGMGPEATCDLFKKIINLTYATNDQEHLHIIIDNNTNIPDRTQYIYGYGEDPRIEMIRSIIKLEAMGVDYIAIPCNTAHYFYDDIVKYTKVKIIHMIYETAFYLKNNYPDNKDYLLLATEGTYISGIYHKIFKEYDLKIIEPNDIDKQIIMNWIYKVKSSKIDITLAEFESLVNRYTKNTNIPIILGCTELPVLVDSLASTYNMKKEYIDPTLILARRCVELANKEIKGKLVENGAI